MLKDKQVVVIDTETTGLKYGYHEVIEFAGYIPSTGETLELKLKPRHIERADSIALKINGYNERDWSKAIEPEKGFITINEFLIDKIIVGHNIFFDYTHLKMSLDNYNISSKMSRRCVDTYTLAYEHLVPLGLESLSLESICNFLGFSNKGAHAALIDVFRTYEVYKYLLRVSPQKLLLLKAKLSLKKKKDSFLQKFTPKL